MIRTYLYSLSILLCLFFYEKTNYFAQGFQVNFQGQKQQGMGCAGSAFLQDNSALFYNPGGVSFLENSSVNVASTPVFGNVLFQENNTQKSYRSNSPIGTPFSAYFLLNFKKYHRLKAGLSVTTPFGSTVQYEEDWIGRFALTRLELKAIHIQPTISFKITDNIGIGAGLVVSTGKVNLQKDLPLQFSNGDFGHVELSGKALGLGYNVGIHLRANQKLNTSLSYRSKINMGVDDGQVDFTVPESLISSFPDGKLTSSLPLPSVITLGASFAPNKRFTFVMDVNRVGWKAYDTLFFDYEQNTSSLNDTKSARNYKSIFAFRTGAQFLLRDSEKGNKYFLRAGAGYGFSPVQSGYLTPETPDGNRMYFTGGTTFSFKDKLSLDLSFYFTKITRSDTNLETQLSGTYTTIALAPGIGIIYTW